MNAPTFDRRLIGLAIIPVAIIGLVYVVIHSAGQSGIVFTTLDIPPFPDVGVAVAEAKLRYFWLSALVLLTAVSLAVAASSALSLLRDAPRRDRVLMFGLVAMVWVAIAVPEQSSLNDHWYVYMGDGLFEGVFSRVSAGSITALQALNIGLDVSNLATVAALLMLVAGFLTTLTQAPANATKQQQADHLADAIARQRTLLQHAALLCVSFILSMLSWMYWPLPFMADAAMEAAYRELLVGAAILHGVGFSLGVAAIYLPPALVLRSRVERSAHLINEGEAGKAIQATIGSHPFDQFRQIAVMVSPAIVSMLPVLKDIFQVT